MRTSLADKLKELRKAKKVSQEKFAEYLGVSYQAVSKWENGITSPDITLLPEIARYFGITVDELLQVEQINENALYDEYEAKTAQLCRNGRDSETLALWQEAYKKMPNNIEVKEMLMSAYFDTDKAKYQKEIIELGTEIFHGDYPSYYKGQAVKEIARTYAFNGNREMAEKWAFKAFSLMHSREMLFVQITDDGEEMLSEFRFANYWYLNRLFYMAARMSGCDSVPGGLVYTHLADKAIAAIYELVFPDLDMGFEDLQRLCVQYRSIAEDEVSLTGNEEAIKNNLTRAVECALKSLTVKEHDLVHPLVKGWKVYDAPEDNTQIVRLLKSELAWQCFDAYRNRDWFIELIDKLNNA